MNMLPGDTKALSPSGLRLGVPELTRLGMGVDEMDQVGEFFQKVLLEEVEPSRVKQEVKEFKKEFRTVRYCFQPGEAYP